MVLGQVLGRPCETAVQDAGNQQEGSVILPTLSRWQLQEKKKEKRMEEKKAAAMFKVKLKFETGNKRFYLIQ